MGKYIGLFIVAWLFAACGNSGPGEISTTTAADSVYTIQQFVAKLQPIRYPWRHHIEDAGDYGFRVEGRDTLFVPADAWASEYLPDTSNYYGIIYYGVGDYFYPYLKTFDKQGNVISDQALVDAGGVDECLRASSEVVLNKEGFEITCVKVFPFCEGELSSCDSFLTVAYRVAGTIQPDGTIKTQRTDDVQMTFATRWFFPVIDASTQKFVYQDSLDIHEFWISRSDNYSVQFLGTVFTSSDGCGQLFQGKALYYSNKYIESDEYEDGVSFWVDEYRMDQDSSIVSFKIAKENRDRMRLVVNPDSVRCGLKESVLQVKPWF